MTITIYIHTLNGKPAAFDARADELEARGE